MSDHSQRPRDRAVDDLLGAFALDAVDPEERALVERHLAADPAARAEVDAMRETAAVLASIPREGQDPPADLWDRIAGAIGAASAGLASSPSPTPQPPAREGREATLPFMRERARRQRSVPIRVVAPLAAAAAILVVLLAVQVGNRTPNRAGNLAAAYDQAVAHGATTVALDAATGGPVAARIALRPDGAGFLRNERLAALPAGRTYQLWAVTGSGASQRAISAGVLGRDPSAVAFHVASKPDAFAITVEDAPGVVQSTNRPAAVGEVRT